MRKIENTKFQKGFRNGTVEVLRVDNSIEYKRGSRTYYVCRCDCGSEMSVSISSLSNSEKNICPCVPNIDLVGREFGKIKIVKFAGFDNRYKSKKAKWTGVCSACKKEKNYLQEVLVRGAITSCGKCRPKGKKRYRYNPKPKRFNKRDSPEYKNWIKSVFKRDGYKCICCGKRGWINAHHLNGWNWCIQLRFDVSNGVTLCAGKGNCHNNFHDTYGRGNNTISQFAVYIKKFNLNIGDILKRNKGK